MFEHILEQQIVHRLGWVLVHFVWQAAVVAFALAILLRTLNKSTASFRYIVCCFALGLIVLLPIVSMQVIPVSVSEEEAQIIRHRPAHVSIPSGDVEEGPTAQIKPANDQTQSSTVKTMFSRQSLTDTLEPVLPYIVLGWLIGVFGLSTWHIGGWSRTQRLRRRMVKQVDVTLNDKLRILAQKLGVNQSVQLLESGIVQIPTLVGWLRPMILLPASTLTGLSTEQLESILTHELAHIKRLDYLVNMLQTVVETLGFYHPAVWWVSRKIRIERENCCDDIAARICGDQMCYAEALTILEQIRSQCAGLALAATGGSLFDRIMRLVGNDFERRQRASWIPFMTAILIIALLVAPTTLILAARAGDGGTSTPLHQAVAAGEIERVKSLLSEGADVNAKDEKGNTPLHLVAEYGYKKQDIAELLIARGANVNARNKEGWTSLHFTAWRSYTDHWNIAGLLIAKSADTNARDKYGCIPLQYAAGSGSKGMIKMLLDNGSDVNSKDKNGWTALYHAIDWAEGDSIEILLAKGADVNVKDNNNFTPLHHAARRNNSLVKMLIEGGADIDAGDSDSCTALHYAALRGADEMAETLLARGADVDARTDHGATPLHYAAYDDRKGVVEILLAKGANVNAKTNAGDTPASAASLAGHDDICDLLTSKGGNIPTVNSLFSVAKSGNISETKSLIEQGADVNARDWRGWTALHYAARAGNRGIIQLLVSRGANVNIQNKEGLTPLHLATDLNCAQTLIANKADVNIQDNDGWAPLHCAARDGRLKLAEILIDAGADVNPTNICRKPLHWAVMKGHIDIVKLLIEKGADVNADDCHSDKPLHYAVWGKINTEAATLLLDNGADPDPRDMSSFTPLHYAAGRSGSKDMVKLLINKGADMNLDNGWNGTPLSIAKKKGHTEIVELLRKHGAKE